MCLALDIQDLSQSAVKRVLPISQLSQRKLCRGLVVFPQLIPKSADSKACAFPRPGLSGVAHVDRGSRFAEAWNTEKQELLLMPSCMGTST